MVPLTIAIVVLVIFSGLFSATETAYSCANRIKIKSMIALGKKNAKNVYKLAEEKYDKLITTILIGNNIVNLTASALGTVLFTKLLINSSLDATTVSTAVMTLSVLIFGEITPKYFAGVYPEKFTFILYPFIQFFYWIFTPLGYVFGGYKKLLARIFRLKPNDTVTDEELISLVNEAEEDGTLKEDESELVRSALEFDDLKVEDILVPRVDVVAVNMKASMDEIFAVFKDNCYSRLPVYEDTIDHVVGLIHERDFYNAYLRGDKEIAHVVQEIAFTTEYTRISTLLKQLQKQKIHMAAVSDEYGGLVGVVTMEDILEELVGEIWDEHDEVSEFFKKLDETTYSVDTAVDFEDFCDFFHITDNTEMVSLSGWVAERLGKVPEKNDSFTYGSVAVTIAEVDSHRTERIIVRVLPQKTQGAEENHKHSAAASA